MISRLMDGGMDIWMDGWRDGSGAGGGGGDWDGCPSQNARGEGEWVKWKQNENRILIYQYFY